MSLSDDDLLALASPAADPRPEGPLPPFLSGPRGDSIRIGDHIYTGNAEGIEHLREAIRAGTFTGFRSYAGPPPPE